MKIKLKNGKEIDYLIAFETEEYFNGSSRRTLTFECDKNAISVDELNKLLSNEDNLKEIILTNENVAVNIPTDKTEQSFTNIYSDYILKLKCGIENKLVIGETPETKAVYEDRIIFKLGKRTYIEEQLEKLGL